MNLGENLQQKPVVLLRGKAPHMAHHQHILAHAPRLTHLTAHLSIKGKVSKRNPVGQHGHLAIFHPLLAKQPRPGAL